MSKNPLQNFMHHLIHIAARAEFASHSDQQLLQRYIDHRDELAFAEVVRRHGDLVWHVCKRVLRNNHDAEDAYQATFTALVRKVRSMMWRETIDGWLHDVAYRIATKAKVEWARRRAREDRRAHMREENFDSGVSRWEMGEVLDKELTYIPEKYRVPLILCYLEGMTCGQAAQRLGIPVRTLEWRLERGRAKLRERLSKYGMDLGQAMLMAGLSTDAGFNHVPPGLMEKTLDIVRILTLSNGALETVGISPHVATLAKGVVGIWSLKVKIVVGFVLTTLAVAGGGIATYSGWLNLGGRQCIEQKIDRDNKTPAALKTDEKRPPRIDLYGDPLPPGALARGGTTRLRHISNWAEGGAESVVFTHDGRALFTTGRNDPVRLWDVASGQLLRQFGDREVPAHTPATSDFSLLALSTDGTTLASCPRGRRLFLWNVATGKLLRQWDAEHITALSFSPDGTALLTAGIDNVIHVREIATGRALHRCVLEQPLSDNEIWFAISPNGKCLASVWSNRIVQLWDAVTGKMLHQLPRDKNELGSPAFVAFSPDGKFLATASAAIEKDSEKDTEACDGAVHVWEVATGKEVRQIGSDPAGTWSVAFSPDGKMLATGSGAGPIRLWEVATGKEVHTCHLYRSHIVSLAFSPDGQRLASGASLIDHTARVWEVATGLELGRTLGGHTGAVNSLTFTPDGQTVMSAGTDGRVGLWDTETGRELRAPERAGDCHACAGLLPDGKTIVSIGTIFHPHGKSFRLEALRSPTRIRLWDAVAGKELRQFPGADIQAHAMYLSSNGQALVCLGYSGSYLTVFLWNIGAGEGHVLSDEQDIGMPLCAVFSPDSRMIAVGSWGGFVTFWDVATGKKVARHQVYQGWVDSLAFSPDGRLLATAGSDTLHVGDGQTDLCQLNQPTIRLWRYSATNPAALEEIKVLPMMGHSGRIHALTFSPDGRTLASAGQGGTVRLWETATGKERRCFSGHQGEVRCLAFTPDGRRLASGSNDTTFLIWDITGRLDHGRLSPARLVTAQQEQLWAELAGADAMRAGEAIWTLAAAKSSTVSFFQARLRPASREAAEESGELLRDLRAIEVLEQMRNRGARRLLEVLSTGNPKANKTQEAQAALQRLNKR